jgi:TfoX/Sxy family transcriptional regulator of competence genes
VRAARTVQVHRSTGGVSPAVYDRTVAYDENLADRMREIIGAERGLQEKKMFGGLAFLVGGNMAIAASGQGGVLVRVDPEKADHLIESTKAEVAVMGNRPMSGWLRVAPDDLVTKRQLAKWVNLGLGYAHALPEKPKKKKR